MRTLRPLVAAGLFAALFATALPATSTPGQTTPSQPNDPFTGMVLGRLVDGLSDRGLSGIVVSIIGGTTKKEVDAPRRVLTDKDGRFLFRNLSAGEYSFSASDASGSMIGGIGMRRPGGTTTPLVLASAERVTDIIVRAWQSASVAGTLLDDRGEPVAETRVSALRVEIVGGRRSYRPANNGMTDDRGAFTISGLIPGEYTLFVPYMQVTVPLSVRADYDKASSSGSTGREEFMRTLVGVDTMSLTGSGPRIDNFTLVRSSNVYGADGPIGPVFTSPAPDASGHVMVYPYTYFENTTSLATAATFVLDSGEERRGVDLQVHLVPGVRVSGHVAGPDGPGAMLGVRLVPQGATGAADESALEAARTTTDAAGNFTFLGVPAGQYTVKIARVPNNTRPATQTSVNVGGTTFFTSSVDTTLPPLPISDTPTVEASTPLAIGTQDLRNVLVTLASGPRITGHVEYDGTATHLTADQLVRATITLDRADGRTFMNASGKGQFDQTGAFRTVGLLSGSYLLRVGGNLGPWSLLSATVKGHDLADVPFNIESVDVSNVVITLTDRTTAVRGTVRDASGNPDGGAVVLLFSADRARWSEAGASPDD